MRRRKMSMLKDELETLRLKQNNEYLKLLEVAKLTEDLAQAIDRRDEVVVRMLLTERETLLLQLQEMDLSVREGLLSQPEADAIRLSALLNGAEAQAPEEEALSAQVIKKQQLLEKINLMDKRISTRLGGKRSYYNSLR